jgi:hypothetical protein
LGECGPAAWLCLKNFPFVFPVSELYSVSRNPSEEINCIVVDGGLASGLMWTDMQAGLSSLYGKLFTQFPAAFAKFLDT